MVLVQRRLAGQGVLGDRTVRMSARRVLGGASVRTSPGGLAPHHTVSALHSHLARPSTGPAVSSPAACPRAFVLDVPYPKGCRGAKTRIRGRMKGLLDRRRYGWGRMESTIGCTGRSWGVQTGARVSDWRAMRARRGAGSFWPQCRVRRR